MGGSVQIYDGIALLFVFQSCFFRFWPLLSWALGSKREDFIIYTIRIPWAFLSEISLASAWDW